MGGIHHLPNCLKKKVSTPVIEDETVSEVTHNPENVAAMQQVTEDYPELFPVSKTQDTAVVEENIPVNLPTSTVGLTFEDVATNTTKTNDEIMTELENHAHAQKVLLSSDAVRYLVADTEEEKRFGILDTVIGEAKKHYPLEDGWLVINESRMRNLCTECKNAAEKDSFTPAVVAEGAGSLAEAIVTGNLPAAYELIGRRPMFELADASADLDALYRSRRGGEKPVSDLLTEKSVGLSDEQIKDMIAALTGALDGTYSDEAAAVKVAVAKAIAVVG